MKRLNLLLQAILAGICIGVGGVLFLSIENKIVGSFMFTLGLFTICTFKFHLFTGRIGYIVENDIEYAKSLFYTWLGNLIGTSLVAFLISLTRNYETLYLKVFTMCEVKLNDSILSILILSIFCGMLMYIAVDGFKKNEHELGKYIGLFICVAGFILAGFEHCIANMFYFSLANVWSLNTLIYLFVMTLGNSIGGCLLPLCSKMSQK